MIKQKKVFMTALVLFLLFDAVLLVDNLQNKTPVVGVFFDEQPAFIYTHPQLTKLIQKELSENEKPLLFSYKGTTITVSRSDIGYTVDAAKAANSMLLVGRQGGAMQRLGDQVKALFGAKNIPLSGDVSKGLLTVTILGIGKEINKPAIPAHPDFLSNTKNVIPASTGVQVDSKKLSVLILENINKPRTTPIQLPVIVIPVNSDPTNEIDNLRNQANLLAKAPIQLQSGGQIFQLSVQDLKNMMIIVQRPDPKNSKKLKPYVRIDEVLLNRRLGDFAATVESLTHAEFNEHEARLAIYNQLYTGNRSVITIPTGGSLTSSPVLAAETTSATSSGAATPSAAQKVAYLTFDDGPNTLYHPLILDILKQYGVVATFFMVGQNIPLAHDVAIRTYTDGHAVGNHSYSHAFLPNYSSTFIANEMLKTNKILESINNNTPVTLFRPPYGGINSTVITNAHIDNLQVFLWDLDPRDWTEPSVSTLVNRVVNQVRNGSDVLMHSNHLVTAQALPQIITRLQSEGYVFKTLNDYPKSRIY